MNRAVNSIGLIWGQEVYLCWLLENTQNVQSVLVEPTLWFMVRARVVKLPYNTVKYQNARYNTVLILVLLVELNTT